MAPNAQSVALSVFRFVLVAILACVLLIGTVILVAASIAWTQDDRWDNPRYLTIGFVCGLIAWLFVAVFHLRRETQLMSFTQRDQFIAKARTVLQEMGYVFADQHGNLMTFRPRFQAYLLGGGIQVALDNQEAKVTGPKVSLEIFRRCFRLLNHVQRVQVYLQEHRKFTDNVIKRVEVRLRLRPDQFEEVRKHIIALLQKEGRVTCQLNLLVQSDKGMRESLLEGEVRDWLRQAGIDCDIHKDLIQFVEAVQPDLETEAASR